MNDDDERSPALRLTLDLDGAVDDVTLTVSVCGNAREVSVEILTEPVNAALVRPTVPEGAAFADLPKLTGSRLAIVNAVTAGASRPRDIEAATGLKHRQVADRLKELVVAGYLIQPRYGRYQRAA